MPMQSRQIEHFYPEQIRILDIPYLNHLCAVASHKDCRQPQFNRAIKAIFRQLLIEIISDEWPQLAVEQTTRMTDLHPEVRLNANVFDREQNAVCVDVARAGMLPSQVFMDQLNDLMVPEKLRHDHLFASRATDNQGTVTHTDLLSSKIGGGIDKALLLIPDPMGATGSSLCQVVEHYKKNVPGTAKKIISAHMIITPEFIQKVTTEHPDMIVYAARLDRGFSSEEALNHPPGKLWEQEKGLNDSQYIVPGAGGVGELINNSFV